MKSPLAALMVSAALLALPGAALAQQPTTPPAAVPGPTSPIAPASPAAIAPGATATGTMAPMKPTANGATMLCRPAAQGEKPTAMMGTTPIVCKTMDKMMQNGMMMVPNTKSNSDDAWKSWLNSALAIPITAGGNG